VVGKWVLMRLRTFGFGFQKAKMSSLCAPRISALNESPTITAFSGATLSSLSACKKIAGFGLRTPRSPETAILRRSK
jgi:hypothetical protein